MKGFKRLEELGSVMRTHDVVFSLSLLFLCRVMQRKRKRGKEDWRRSVFLWYRKDRSLSRDAVFFAFNANAYGICR